MSRLRDRHSPKQTYGVYYWLADRTRKLPGGLSFWIWKHGLKKV